MSKKFQKNIKNLKDLSFIIKDANLPAFNDVVEKYKNGTILRFDSAFNLVMKLSNARGTGQSKTREKIANIGKPKIQKPTKTTVKQTKSKLDVGIDDDEGIISTSTKSKKTPEAKPIKTFYITASIEVETTYISKVNVSSYPKKHTYQNISKDIEANTVEEAKEIYINLIISDLSPNYARGQSIIKSIEYISVVDKSEMKATPTEEMMMKRAKAVKYTFLPEVFDKHEKNDNLCVFNTFVATYKDHIKKLTQERFIELCYQVQGIQITNTNSLNSLDKDVEDDEEPEMIKNTWKKEDGISPKMLFEICKILNISHYAFDATNKCF